MNCEPCKTAKGFSLIELMIVIAIVGILATISIPSYQNYIGKAKMAGVITILEGFKPQLEEAIMLKTMPAAINGCPAGVYCSYTPTSTINRFHYSHRADNTQAWVEALLTAELGGGRLQLHAVENRDGSITWYCGYWFQGSIEDSWRYTPTQCQNNNLIDLATP